MTDDLRTKAREASVRYSSSGPRWRVGTMRDREERAFQEGALWHASQQPSREEIADVLGYHAMEQCSAPSDVPGARLRWYQCAGCGHETNARDTWYSEDACAHAADAVLRLLDRDGSNRTNHTEK